MKIIGIRIGQIILLMIGYFAISLLSGSITGSTKFFDLTREQEIAAGIGLIYVSFLFSSLLLYVCIRSNWFGLKLLLAILSLHFGITVFLTQVESYVFLDQLVRILPEGSLPILVIDNSISALLFSILAVAISGKWKKGERVDSSNRLKMSSSEWILKLTALGIGYYFIYAQFGAFVMVPIAGHEAFHSYYSGLQMPSWMFIFQVFRGMVWVIIGLPMIAMFKGNKHEMAIAVGLSFAILMGANLLIPLPFMPERIRIAHLVEVMTSNFLFGIIVTYVMTWRLLKQESRTRESRQEEDNGQTGTDTQQAQATITES